MSKRKLSICTEEENDGEKYKKIKSLIRKKMPEIRFNMDNMTGPLNKDCDGAKEDDSTEEISDQIVKGDGSEGATLCMFYAMYNGFRDKRKRDAFSNFEKGKGKGQFFIKYINSIPEYENTNWKKFGYNAYHMGHYLKHLKNSKIIKSYIWKRRVQNWDFQSFFCSGSGQKNTNILLFGNSVPTFKRNYATTVAYKKMKESTLILSKHESMKIQCDFYRNWSDKYKGPEYPHGGSICREDGIIYWYDNARKHRQIATLEIIAANLVKVFDIYEFDIEIM
jgi:hypothetical protein